MSVHHVPLTGNEIEVINTALFLMEQGGGFDHDSTLCTLIRDFDDLMRMVHRKKQADNKGRYNNAKDN